MPSVMKASAEVSPWELCEVDRPNENPENKWRTQAVKQPGEGLAHIRQRWCAIRWRAEEQLSTAVDRSREGILYRTLVAPSQGDRVYMGPRLLNMAYTSTSTRVKAPVSTAGLRRATRADQRVLMTSRAQSLLDGCPTPTAPVLNPAGKRRGLHKEFRVATWNVLTMFEAGHQLAIVRKMNGLNVLFAGLTESRMVAGHVISVESCFILHSGEKTCTQGVALFLCASLAKSLHSWG